MDVDGLKSCLRLSSDGQVTLAVHAKPGAKKAAITGVSNGSLSVSINAPPRDGEANGALVEYIAEVLNVKKRHVALQSGGKSREKVFKVEGVTLDDAVRALQAAVEG